MVDEEGHWSFNGQSFDEAAKWMGESYFKGDFGKVGYIFAATMDKEIHMTPGPKPDRGPKMGAEFAQGMLKAMKVGEFEIKDLFECLEKEEKAEKIFEKGTHELVWAMKKQDVKLAI